MKIRHPLSFVCTMVLIVMMAWLCVSFTVGHVLGLLVAIGLAFALRGIAHMETAPHEPLHVLRWIRRRPF